MALQDTHIAFIGGGNMATAIIGGLIRQGLPPDRLQVVEPWAEARERLARDHGVQAEAAAGSTLGRAALVVWAVKPQTFREAAQPVAAHTAGALHLSVAAGIRSDSIARWLASERVVRCMPNTPALVGRGMTALFARAAVTPGDRALAEQVLAPTGATLWVDQEVQLDAVTALSGSGPAYVFYFIEAMAQAGQQMGLPADKALQLAIGTFGGAAELARTASEPPQVLRERVTSKGGTTYAALTAMEQSAVGRHFIEAMHAACRRAAELGDEFGRD
ncbi:pyrroline-5-carboxylate reductase [Ramlibacter sp.]|uniref:pyrroline-5-carboxylate reductase n=1 Tax=Ramlibacter sp. TaxID=1917967 RepID=UPI002D66F867|nr:pyrroline-5-carboxylate reductase [Ramlibacter sp.]HYD77386.1 pyrroline-5-carboxylate reductase [Ramlibacter sp.]